MTWLTRSSSATAGILLGLLAGCASPGPPRPPSLNLPKPVTNLRAERRGNTVHLEWTAPERTTDGMLLPGVKGAPLSSKVRAPQGPLAAELCRADLSAPRIAGKPAPECIPFARSTVLAGSAQVLDDQLPAELQTGPPRLLEYRVRTLNAAGRSADLSAPALVPAGAVPVPMTHVGLKEVRDGAELSWAKAQSPLEGESVLLFREEVENPEQTKPSVAGSKKRKPSPVELRISASPDPGGTVDTAIVREREYRYTVTRVRSVTVGGKTFLMRGESATVLSGKLHDVFPPRRPSGLAAIATPATTSAMGAHKAAMDLSWEPNTEADLVGYNIYRADQEGAKNGVWKRISPSPVTGTSFHDEGTQSGSSYQYRVTAVDTSGNESAPSATAEETLP